MNRPLALIIGFFLWLRGNRTRPRVDPAADRRDKPGPPATGVARRRATSADPWVTPDGHPNERLSPWK